MLASCSWWCICFCSCHRWPLPPINVRLTIGGKTMSDVVCTWNKPASGVAPTSYSLQWTVNGAPVGGAFNVPQSATGDASGYSSPFSAANPGVPLVAGQVIDVNIDSVDTPDGTFSTAVTPPAVTVPTPPPPVPLPPINVALSYTP